MPDTTLSALTAATSVPYTALFYGESAGTSLGYLASLMAGHFAPHTAQGRLTLETGVPVSTTDQLAKGTLYYTPYLGNVIALYNGTGWKMYALAEKSLALTVTSGKNYDVFLKESDQSLQLSAAWTTDTARADALATQDGIPVKSADHTLRHVGTIRASGTNLTADSGGEAGTTQVGATRFVWNRYNQVRRSLKVIDTTDSWVYKNVTIRQANGAGGNRVEYVTGDVETHIDITAHGTVYFAGGVNNVALTGIGVDSTTVFAAGVRQAGYLASATTGFLPVTGRYVGTPGLGYHALNWLEAGAADATTCTFIGDDGGDGTQDGLHGTLWA
jgi:hypothetical protein